jgi:hypothetical protein
VDEILDLQMEEEQIEQEPGHVTVEEWGDVNSVNAAPRKSDNAEAAHEQGRF